MYFGKPPRIYVLTKKEIDSNTATCPKCGNVLSLVPFTKSDKLYRCETEDCGFHIQKSCVMKERPTIVINTELVKIAKDIQALVVQDSEIQAGLKIIEKFIKANFPYAKYEVIKSHGGSNGIGIKPLKSYRYVLEFTKYESGSLHLEVVNGNMSTGFATFQKEELKQKLELYLNKWLKMGYTSIRDDFGLKSKSTVKLEDVHQYVWSKYRMNNEYDDDDKLEYATRDNGDVGEEKAGAEDVKRMKEIAKDLLQKFGDKNIYVELEIVDEWVNLTVGLK